MGDDDVDSFLRAVAGEPVAVRQLPARVGTRVAERFELLSRAGRGGMGEVWKAHDLERGALVALKRMIDPDDAVGRFMREARLLARVSFCNVESCDLAGGVCNNEQTRFGDASGGTTISGGTFSGTGYILFSNIDVPAFGTPNVWCAVPVPDAGVESIVKRFYLVHS